MKVRFYLTATIDKPHLEDVDLPQVPMVGDTVDIPRISQTETVVRTVVWYAYQKPEPLAYVVLGPRRPGT